MRDKIIQDLEQQRREADDKKKQKHEFASEYYQDLAMQEQCKLQAKRGEKVNDQEYLKIGSYQVDLLDQNRQKVFDNMRKHQERNEAKQKALSNFLQDDLAQLSRKDEATYMKAIEERNRKEKEREDRDR